MAERLGEALLALRTDDARFNAGVEAAKAKAELLGTAMDKTSGSSARLATEMRQTGQAATTTGEGFEQAGRKVTASAGQQRAGMQQLSFQLNDIATMYSLGARPMQIFASQSGQVVQAVQMMSGGTSKLAGFLGGPWGIALTSAAIVLTPLISKLFEAEDAMQAVEFAADRMGDAQDILADVLDRTTGKMITQRKEAIALARALSLQGLLESRQRRSEAERELRDIGQGSLQLQGGMGGGLFLTREGNGARDLVAAFRQGSITAEQATQRIQDRVLDGDMTPDEAMRTTQALTSVEVETANEAEFQNNLDLLDGNGDLDPPEGDKRGRRTRRRERSGPSQEEIAARYDRELISITQSIISARIQIATSAEERAELQRQLVEWDRRVALASIAADEDLSEAQKAELSAATTRLADAELQAIEFSKSAQLEREAADLAQERYSANRDALGLQLDLADTEEERKKLALRMLEVEEDFLRQRLIAITVSETATDAERQRAQVALDALRATAGDRRAAVARANETTVERYLRDLNKSPEQINEALDKISIDGLDQLEDSLVNVIRGVESLGDLFSKVADQIIADLLRIAIQQAIIKPLANSLFGGGGGPFDLLSFSSLFAGAFATGGLIPDGQFGIVGENGPEVAFADAGGVRVLSSTDSQSALKDGGGGGTSVSIPISIDATGADPAALARLERRLQQLQRDLPGVIVTTVQDASDRRIIQTGGR
jgi:hypothetical protein